MLRRLLSTMFVGISLLAAGAACTGPAASSSPTVRTEASATALPLTPQPVDMVAPTVAPSTTPTATSTAQPTSAPSSTIAPTATPTVQPSDTPLPSPTPQPHVVVKPDTLNVRSGPGSNYPIVGKAAQGDTLVVVGQAKGCAWLSITTTAGVTGWVSGGADYVTLQTACEIIPAAAIPPSPTPLPPPPPTATTVPVTPTAEADELPADKGCILFENYFGGEVVVTLTERSLHFNYTFKLPAMGKHVECLDPGHYTYSLNGPWGEQGSGAFDDEAGKHFRFPIVKQN